MSLLFDCIKMGLIGFGLGHVALIVVLYWLGQRYPQQTRAVLRRLALLIFGPDLPPSMPVS
ncbi:MAG: hypothetical protein QM770_07515 [Tepidisphaeraceae bacterium]